LPDGRKIFYETEGLEKKQVFSLHSFVKATAFSISVVFGFAAFAEFSSGRSVVLEAN
jgi:hypothetical protein